MSTRRERAYTRAPSWRALGSVVTESHTNAFAMATLLRWFKPARARPSTALLLRFAAKMHWHLPTSRPQKLRLLRSALVASIAAAGVSGLGAACEAGALSRADALFDANEYAQLADLLRAALSSRPDDAQLLWCAAGS